MHAKDVRLPTGRATSPPQRIFYLRDSPATAAASVTPLPGTLDGAIDGLAQCDLRTGAPFIAEGGEGLTFHCVLEGTMFAAVDDAAPLRVPSGSALLLPSGRSIALSAQGQPRKRSRTPDARVMIGLVSPRAAATLGLDKVAEPIVHDIARAPGAAPMIEALAAELDKPALGTVPLLSALMKLCLIHTARDLNAGGKRAGETKVARAVSAVLADPGAAHSIASLADLAMMSRATFVRHFVKSTGANPMQFVAKARLDHAAELLRSTDLPVKVVASRAGYLNRGHFARAFREAHGFEPSAFRANVRPESIEIEAQIPAT